MAQLLDESSRLFSWAKPCSSRFSHQVHVPRPTRALPMRTVRQTFPGDWVRGCATSRRPAGGRVAGAWQVRGRCVAGAHAPPLGACPGARLPRCLSPEAAEPSSGAPFAEQGASRRRLRPHRSKPPLPGSHFGSFHFKQNLPGGQTASQGCHSQQVLSRPRRWH